MTSQKWALAERGSSRDAVSAGERDGPFEDRDGSLDWRLPSGQTLAEFALRSGFLAPPLMSAGTAPEPPRPVQESRPWSGEENL
jgi:hypothetical protein